MNINRHGVYAAAVLGLGLVRAASAYHDYDYTNYLTAGCDITTTEAKMNFGKVRELAYFADTESDEACFLECLKYYGWDYDTDYGVECTATVRRTNGDCYLHALTLADAQPTNMKTYVSYCVEVDECSEATKEEDCAGIAYPYDCGELACAKEGEFMKCGVKSTSGASCFDYDPDTCSDTCSDEGYCEGIPCKCEVTTSTEKMTITGRELEFYGNTVSDAECYDYCKWYTSWDYDDVDSKVTLCNASVRRSTNGDCYLHAKGIEAAEPTNMKTYVTHCPESTAPKCTPKTTTDKKRISGPDLLTARNTESDAACFQLCQDFSVDGKKCNASVRRPSNGDCYLYEQGIDAAKPTNMKVYTTYCA